MFYFKPRFKGEIKQKKGSKKFKGKEALEVIHDKDYVSKMHKTFKCGHNHSHGTNPQGRSSKISDADGKYHGHAHNEEPAHSHSHAHGEEHSHNMLDTRKGLLFEISRSGISSYLKDGEPEESDQDEGIKEDPITKNQKAAMRKVIR